MGRAVGKTALGCPPVGLGEIFHPPVHQPGGEDQLRRSSSPNSRGRGPVGAGLVGFDGGEYGAVVERELEGP